MRVHPDVQLALIKFRAATRSGSGAHCCEVFHCHREHALALADFDSGVPVVIKIFARAANEHLDHALSPVRIESHELLLRRIPCLSTMLTSPFPARLISDARSQL